MTEAIKTCLLFFSVAFLFVFKMVLGIAVYIQVYDVCFFFLFILKQAQDI